MCVAVPYRAEEWCPIHHCGTIKRGEPGSSEGSCTHTGLRQGREGIVIREGGEVAAMRHGREVAAVRRGGEAATGGYRHHASLRGLRFYAGGAVWRVSGDIKVP